MKIALLLKILRCQVTDRLSNPPEEAPQRVNLVIPETATTATLRISVIVFLCRHLD